MKPITVSGHEEPQESIDFHIFQQMYEMCRQKAIATNEVEQVLEKHKAYLSTLSPVNITLIGEDDYLDENKQWMWVMDWLWSRLQGTLPGTEPEENEVKKWFEEISFVAANMAFVRKRLHNILVPYIGETQTEELRDAVKVEIERVFADDMTYTCQNCLNRGLMKEVDFVFSQSGSVMEMKAPCPRCHQNQLVIWPAGF